jgi:ketosteroid isomerase-like protein
MHKQLPALAVAVLVLCGCGGAPPTAAESMAGADKAAVEATTAAFHQALRTNGFDTFMSYVAEDVFFMPPGEPPIRGREALRKWMMGFLAQYRTSSLTLANREVHVGGGWAVELGTYEWALQPVAGGLPIVDRGNYMQVWQQQGDKTWRFSREVYNSSVPPVPVPAK